MKKYFIVITIFLSSNILTFANNGFGFTFDAGSSSIINMLSTHDSILPTTVYYITNNTKGKYEFSLGFVTSASDASDEDELNFITMLGIGKLFNTTKSNDFCTYVGGRLSTSIISNSDDVRFLIAPVYGAEYSFSDNFSIGGETRFNISIVNHSGSNESDYTTTITTSSAHLFFRFYN